jgi:hypothetical protein
MRFLSNIWSRVRGLFGADDFAAASAFAEPGPAAKRHAADAQDPSVLSVRESGNNRGKYVETYQRAVGIGPGDPWCQAFAYFRLKKAADTLGIRLPADFPRTGYTPTGAGWFKKKGLWIPVSSAKRGVLTPAVGDWVYFYFPTKGRIAHVGIVVGVDGLGVHTVEGNTSGGPGVEREGGGVFKRYRRWAELGELGGFGRINF